MQRHRCKITDHPAYMCEKATLLSTTAMGENRTGVFIVAAWPDLPRTLTFRTLVLLVFVFALVPLVHQLDLIIVMVSSSLPFPPGADRPPRNPRGILLPPGATGFTHRPSDRAQG